MRLSKGKLNDPRLELKVHYSPPDSDKVTACGQPVTANSVGDKRDVTCKKCLAIIRNARQSTQR